MKKIVIVGLAAGITLFVLSILGLYMVSWFFPALAMQYFGPAFDTEPRKIIYYSMHPFIMGMALSWFWARFKGVLTGSFIARGIEFGLIYVAIATFPMMWLIYSAMSVSILMISSWFVLALLQGVIAGLVCEKLNP
jgi:hypothetical protein